MPGLGVAAADVNNDGLPDLFVAANSGGNLLFLNDGRGKFREAPESRRIFAWEGTGGDNMICGVCFGDVNRDGLLDMVIGQHFSTPWVKPVPIRLYLNRGIQDGNPKFEDVTSAVGLVPLALKAPHVEIQDFDNDGWPDVYTSIVKFADGQPHPVIYRNLGVRDGLPRFRDEAFAVNDFPTAEDKAIRGSGAMFQKIIQEKKIIYMAPGPSGDFDNDGRLDLFLPNWWIESRSLLLRNETPQRNWLQVKLDLPPAQADPSKANEGKPPDKAATSKGPVNRMGIGARVKIYTAGKLGEAAALLGCQDISAGYGYASGQASIAHFGLGDGESVDVEVTLPHGKGALAQRGAKANQRLILKP
jgi:hypothetical protein